MEYEIIAESKEIDVRMALHVASWHYYLGLASGSLPKFLDHYWLEQASQ